MIIEITDYLRKYGRASLFDLSVHFQVEEAAMEKLLSTLEARGRIAKMDIKTCAGGCGSCSMSGCTASQWIIYSLCKDHETAAVRT